LVPQQPLGLTDTSKTLDDARNWSPKCPNFFGREARFLGSSRGSLIKYHGDILLSVELSCAASRFMRNCHLWNRLRRNQVLQHGAFSPRAIYLSHIWNTLLHKLAGHLGGFATDERWYPLNRLPFSLLSMPLALCAAHEWSTVRELNLMNLPTAKNGRLWFACVLVP
jgi:hypothetical protein